MVGKQLYIHIGTHKTGTTTLQKMLLTNKRYLSNCGLYYPTSCMHRAHHNVPWEIANDPRWEKERGTLADLEKEIIINTYKIYLISSEDISRFSLKQTKILYENFKKYNPKIIVYIRNQFNYIVSSWSELIKNCKINISFDEYYEICLKETPNILNYNFFLERWATIFGKENLIVKIFSKGTKHLEESFLDIFNIDFDMQKIEIGDRLNISLSFQTLNVIRTLNKYTQNFGFSTRNNLRKEVIDMISHNYYKNKNLVLPKDRIELKVRASNFFEESNKQVAKDYFGRDQLFLNI